MSDELNKELAYYKRRVDELAGENLKLDYTISGLRHELKQKRQGFALLSELQPRVGADRQISSIFEATIEAINATLGMDRTVVLAPAEAEHVYRPSHWLGYREDVAEQLARIKLALPPEFAGGTQTLIVNKGTAATPLIEEIRRHFDLPFFICVPVMGADTVIGLLLSGRLKEVRPLYPPLDQGDLDTFQAIAGLISASVRNMRVAVLEEMDRLKTDFFANISHEFRTPITLTIGPLEQILAGRYGALPAEAQAPLDVMRRNQERLLGLVSQILDLAKLEAGGMELKASQVRHVNAFVADRVDQFRAAAEGRGLELRTAWDAAADDADAYLDREMFDKVLFNLLSNAVKFTREGHIEVGTEITGNTLRLAVADTGIGIKEDQLPHIFDRFRQADGSESREYAGTGIGLALVQEVARLHGGNVSVYSRYGSGTTFHVTVPLGSAHLNPAAIVDAPAEAAPPRRLDAPAIVIEGGTDREGAGRLNALTEQSFDADRPTIVYAEDNPDLRHHVRDLLRPTYNVFLAVDGRDGLDAIRRYRPDLVITDQMMPNLSGRDLLRAVREDPELRHTPVIFLTARVGTDARIAGLDAGADDYLTKPFHEGELLARVRNLLQAREQEKQLAELNERLEARVEEQMAELVRSGELRRFLPPAVVESVLRGELASDRSFERRRITVLIAEIRGTTELTDQLEPEEFSDLVNDYLRELTAVAVGMASTVETSGAQRFTALFGAPTDMPLEQQAETAVHAALEMRARLGELHTLWQRRGVRAALDLRVGINTGYCTVGAFGSDTMRSYTAIGTPVTVASLLPEQAEANGILCSLASYSLIEGRVVANPLGERTLRGVARPVQLFEVIGLVDERRGADAPAPAPVFLPK
ncbi:MAG TPA: ATP-binding protein [Longimicrobiales bacterium]|nr:ATP-binding protein [Longimicrobiales bacterium]